MRAIGYSTGRYLVTVISVEDAGVTYGVNGWKSDEIDIRRIQDEQVGLSNAEAELRAPRRHLTHAQRHLRQQTS